MVDRAQYEDYFDTRFAFDPARTKVWREIVRYVSKDLPDRKSVLELGPGYCDFINLIDANNKFAVDISEVPREHAAGDVEFRVGDCSNLSFLEPESITSAFASNLLEHLEADSAKRTVAELYRVLVPGGRAAFIQPNYRLCSKTYFEDHTHVTIFTDQTLAELLRGLGMTIVKSVPGLLPFSMRSRLPKIPIMVRAYLNSPIRPLARQMYVVAEKPDTKET